VSRPELVREAAERAAKLCEARAESLAANGQVVAANEALKCAEAIRRQAA
jgi:hypothetical protein